MNTPSKQDEIDDRLAAVEASLLALMKSIAPKAEVVVVDKEMCPCVEVHDEHTSREQRDHESILARLAAIQKSLTNFANLAVGENCHWEQVAVGWRCVKWGSTGNGGTAKCLEYETIYEHRYVC